MVRPADRKEAVDYLEKAYDASERRCCRVLRLNRSIYRRRPRRDEQAFLRMRIKEIAAVRVRYGYRRIHVLLKREGWGINVKRVYRLYKQEGLNLRHSTKRKRANQNRVRPHSEATAANEYWAMDFVSDQLYDGKRFRALTLIDLFTRECLATYADKAIKGEGVCAILKHVSKERGYPRNIKVDNGPEFISRALDAWTYDRKISLQFSRLGTPTDNAHIESFNGSLREECLNTNWFMSLEDAREKLEQWRNDYNEYRPHSALTYLPPAEFARNHAAFGP
jgi:putative transposase